eukprot:c19371_g2_i1 orf=118-387(+)
MASGAVNTSSSGHSGFVYVDSAFPNLDTESLYRFVVRVDAATRTSILDLNYKLTALEHQMESMEALTRAETVMQLYHPSTGSHNRCSME